MEYRFQRDLRNSFMIVCGDLKNIGYEKDILRYNDIAFLVPFSTIDVNNETQVWYDITGLVSLRDYCMQQGITLELIRRILVYLRIGMSEIERYLINIGHLSFDPDTIYVVKDRDEWRLEFIYYPVEESAMNLEPVMEFFMSEAEDNKELMEQCFNLYDLCVQGCTVDGLIEVIDGYDDNYGNIDVIQVEETQSSSSSEGASIINTSYDSEKSNMTSIAHDTTVHIGELFQISNALDTKKESILDKIKNYLRELFSSKKKILIDKSREFVPRSSKAGIFSITPHIDKSQLEDFIYEPDQELYEPTVLLKPLDGNNDNICKGQLEYMGEVPRDNIYITKDEYSIGSNKEGNDMVIDSPVISRYHAKILRESNDYYIQDLNSTNGTSLNGELIGYNNKILLNPGDKIMFANECYRIV